jgi:hypothetical protein
MWNNLRAKMPKNWNTTRIENRFGGGIPDVHVCAEGLPFWIELKVTKTNRVNVSAHQVAWNFAYNQSGGVSFFLIAALASTNLYLFDGVHGRGLADHGLKSGRVGDHGLKSGRVGDHGSGSGSVGSGSVGSGSVGSGSVRVGDHGSGSVGSGTMVPCLWSGSDQVGLQEAMLDFTRRRIGHPAPRAL